MRRSLVMCLIIELFGCEIPAADTESAGTEISDTKIFEESKDSCSGVTSTGECDEAVLRYCENNQLVEVNCEKNNADCVWDEEYQFFTCVAISKDAHGPVASQPSSSSCLACLQGYHCEDNECVPDCVPSCRDKECGDNGCGGSCGQCGDGFKCEDFTCASLSDECWGSTGMSGCPVIVSLQGCCDEYGWVVWCEEGRTYCKYCAQDNPVCGWSQGQGWYDCGTKGETDPSNSFSIACPNQCAPDCHGKKCGDNGCGGSCGFCSSNQICVDGACQDYSPTPSSP